MAARRCFIAAGSLAIVAVVAAGVPPLALTLGAWLCSESGQGVGPGRPVGKPVCLRETGIEQQPALAAHQQVRHAIAGEVGAIEPITDFDVQGGDVGLGRESALAQVGMDLEAELFATKALGMDQHQVRAAAAAGRREVGAQGMPESALGVDAQEGRRAAAAAIARQQEEVQVALDEDAELGDGAEQQRRPAVPDCVGGLVELPLIARQQRPGLHRRTAWRRGDQECPSAAPALRLGTDGEARRRRLGGAGLQQVHRGAGQLDTPGLARGGLRQRERRQLPELARRRRRAVAGQQLEPAGSSDRQPGQAGPGCPLAVAVHRPQIEPWRLEELPAAGGAPGGDPRSPRRIDRVEDAGLS